jgi:hypothetical protein
MRSIPCLPPHLPPDLTSDKEEKDVLARLEDRLAKMAIKYGEKGAAKDSKE